jgi:hypothetical protein
VLSASCSAEELVEFVRLTIPEKPLRLVKLIVAVAIDPALTWIDVTDVRLKSTTFTATVIWWVSEPLVAVTVTR